MKTESIRFLKQTFFILSTIYITAPAVGTADTQLVEKCPRGSSSVLTPMKIIRSILSKQENQECTDVQKEFSRYIKDDDEYFSGITSDKIFREDILSTASTANQERIGEFEHIIPKTFLNTTGNDIGRKTNDALPTANGFKTTTAK